jgi:hypothetical protein
MHSYYDAIARRRAQALDRAGKSKLSKELFDRIKRHSQTKILTKEDLPEAYDYVEGLYPRCAEPISKTPIYKNENTAFFKELGLPSAGGMYIRLASAVVICYNKKFPDDVVAVHELLHAVHALLGIQSHTERQEEDFAYGKSIPYLIDKGHSEDWIVDEYLWPKESKKTRPDRWEIE